MRQSGPRSGWSRTRAGPARQKYQFDLWLRHCRQKQQAAELGSTTRAVNTRLQSMAEGQPEHVLDRAKVKASSSTVVNRKRMERKRQQRKEDLALLAEAPREAHAYRLAAVRYAERRALQAASRSLQGRLGALSSLEYYQERRLRSLNLTPVETEEELDALRADSAPERAAGRER